MISVSQNFSLKHQPKPPKEPKIKNKGAARAQYASSIVALPIVAGSLGVNQCMRKASELSAEDSAQLTKTARQGLKDSGLYEKGARIYKMTEVSLKEVLTPVKKVIKNIFSGNLENIESDVKSINKSLKYGKKDHRAINAFLDNGKKLKENTLLLKLFPADKNAAENSQAKELSKNIGKALGKMQTLSVKLGHNAYCLTENKKIIIPNKHLQTSAFHEMGHALNASGGILLKGLQKCRPLATIVPAVILFASLENKRKVTDETKPDDSILQKGKDFTKRNAGKLTFLAMLPMVAEEGIASLRGQKIAKNLVKSGDLSKNLFRKIKLTNLCGFSTYLLGAAAATATVKAAINIKDKIQEKYEAKQMAKYELKLQKWKAKQNKVN